MTTLTQIIDGLVVTMLNITLYQGRKKLRPEDLAEKGIDTSSLPPEKLASLGSKRIVSPEAVNVFMALKRQAERACLAVGTRCLGGYAIPEARMPALQKELDAIANTFQKEKATFLSQYETTVNAWADENPEWRDAIQRSVDPSSYVTSQLQCGYTVLKVAPAKGAEETLNVQVSGLKGQLEREIALAAKTAWEESFQGKLSVRNSALNKLDAINEKLAGLSFLDGSIGTLNSSVTTVLNQCKGKAAIEGTDLMAVCGILATLIGLDRIRFSSETEAAGAAATMPVLPEPAQPESTVATQPELALSEPPEAPASQEPTSAEPAATTPAIENEEPHFTDMFSPSEVPPVFSKPIIRVNESPWTSTDIPFGGGEAESIVAIVPPSTGPVAIPTEWF